MVGHRNFRFIFCFNDVNMLKGIWGCAPIGMLELWKNGIMIQDVWINELKLWEAKWNPRFTMP